MSLSPEAATKDEPAAPRRRLAVVAVGIFLAVAAGALAWRLILPGHVAAAVSHPPPAAVRVGAAPATPADVPVYLTALGAVQAWTTVAEHTQVDGTLQSVSFNEGQLVHKGDILAQIDPRTYQAAFDQAKAKQDQDQAQLDNAQKVLVRDQELAKHSFASQETLDQQIATVAAGKAQVEADKAAVQSAQTLLDYTTIRASSDARTGIRQVDPGNIVKTTDTTPIVVLTQTTPIAVTFTLPEKNLDAVRAAMKQGPVVAEAYDADNTARLATGELLLIDNVIDQGTGTIRLKARFPNTDEALWPGEFVNVHLLVETAHNALTVPNAAVERGSDGLFAWRVMPNGTVEAEPIETGPTSGDRTIVEKGLSAGDQVVVNGQYRLEPGTRVEIKASAATAANVTAAPGGVM
jgi:multidrug efflux system membrane fusion protein